MTCHISNQIATHCNEIESYCPECESPMTEEFHAGDNWLECDNQQCGHTIDLKGENDD